MAESIDKQIADQINKINLEEKNPEENDEKKFSVEEKYMLDCLNEIGDDEKDLHKIAEASHNFLLANAIKKSQ